MMKSSLKNFFIILQICMSVTVFGQQTPAVREKINLGNTPWKFSKVAYRPLDITPSSVITFQDEKVAGLSDDRQNTTWEASPGQPASLVIDMGSLQNIQSVRIQLADHIDSLRYTIEGAADCSLIWGWVVDYSKMPQKSFSQKVTDVSSTGNTVGYAEKVGYQFNEAKFNGLFRFLRITFLPQGTPENPGKPVSVSEIKVFTAGRNSQTKLSDLTSNKFDDSQWQDVGIPHCFNDSDTYLNSFETNMWKGEVWYRKHLLIYRKDRDKQFYLEFEGVNIGAAVYVNGAFIKGNTRVEQPGEVTHVGGFIPFSVDITDHLKFGQENIIAVRVSNAPGSFFTWPGFGVYDGFGMGWGGLVCPVYLYKMPKVHIPLNSFAASGKWGTYQDAVSASEDEAELLFQTCIENSSGNAGEVLLQTEIYEAGGAKVQSLKAIENIGPGERKIYKQQAILKNPHLWFPNNSPYGKPCLYNIVRTVSCNGKMVDRKEERMGIREITWDDDYCYINHKKHLLRGFGYRNVYPALGSAVPAGLQWNDMALIAACGGNALRVGHVPPATETLKACDEYGIMVILDSGDNEWSLKNEPAISYKEEYDRNSIVAFRNHPAVVIWESNNGIAKDGEIYQPATTQRIAEEWDPIQPRIVLCRDSYPKAWNSEKPIVIGYTNEYHKIEGVPCLNTEVYGANWEGRASWNIARSDYENEKQFSTWFVNNYLSDMENKACGWIDWMLAETQGEGYTIYLNGKAKQKSLGSSAMDGNRFPKLKYKIYQNALWIPFEKKPGVTLQTLWNVSGVQNVDAWSNCPQVELVINGKNWGVRKPDPETKRCTWENMIWHPGKVKALGLDEHNKVVCSDSIGTPGDTSSLVLEVETPLTTPTGKTFNCRANGSDVTIITAKVVDDQGRWCPFANNNVTFHIEGEGASTVVPPTFISQMENRLFIMLLSIMNSKWKAGYGELPSGQLLIRVW